MKNKLGLSTIFILIAIVVTAILLIIALANKGEKVEDIGESTQGGALSQAIEQANDIELFKFNQNLKGYEGKQSGQFLKALYSKVEESNKNNPDHQVKVTGIDSADKIESSKTYSVTFSTAPNGYYNAVNIEENK